MAYSSFVVIIDPSFVCVGLLFAPASYFVLMQLFNHYFLMFENVSPKSKASFFSSFQFFTSRTACSMKFGFVGVSYYAS